MLIMSETNKYFYALGALATGWWVWQMFKKQEHCFVCTSAPTFTAGKFHNVNHALFNVRETAKQLILLEQHIFNPRERCQDCIRKHFIHAEALMEEAVTLDPKGAYPFIRGVASKIRDLIRAFVEAEEDSKKLQDVGQGIRCLRKNLLTKSFYLQDPEKDSSMLLDGPEYK
jgi:hypothetical protein